MCTEVADGLLNCKRPPRGQRSGTDGAWRPTCAEELLGWGLSGHFRWFAGALRAEENIRGWRRAA